MYGYSYSSARPPMEWPSSWIAIWPAWALEPEAVATEPPAPPYFVVLPSAITWSACGARAAYSLALVSFTQSRRSVLASRPWHQKPMSRAVSFNKPLVGSWSTPDSAEITLTCQTLKYGLKSAKGWTAESSSHLLFTLAE